MVRRRGCGSAAWLAGAAASSLVVSALLLLNHSEVWLRQDGLYEGPLRRLHAVGADDPRLAYKWGAWGVRHIVGLVVSIAVSLTSSVDRECGSSLYMVLFACLLDMPFRQAAAMTAFTVALGALGPGIASMSEANITERGILALVDYPGALVLLPTMFWGISFGVIANLVFPNWLLALMWVTVMFFSNLELIFSLRRYRKIKAEAAQVAAQLRQLPSPAAAAAAAAAAPPHTNGAVELASLGATGTAALGGAHHHNLQQQQQAPGQLASPQQQAGQLMARAHELARQAQQIEAVALLYPVLYTPSVERALREAHVGPHPDVLRATATPSVLSNMDHEHVQLVAELPQYQTVFGRFTLAWSKWKHLNNHFELAMVLKIVVLHLVTEAIRHHTAKPCTGRYWFMLLVMTGLVTAFLIFTMYCYTWRRLWRGPHWVDALAQVRQLKKQQQLQELELELAGKDSQSSSAAPATAGRPMTAGAAAVAAGEAVAVGVAPTAGRQPPPAAAAAAAADAAGARQAPAAVDAAAIVAPPLQQQQQGQQDLDEPQAVEKLGCAAKARKRLPWFWGPAEEAITNITDCNSYNQYSKWRLQLMLLCAGVTLPIGALGCALGLPGGLAMSHMLLALGLKPRVVAGTSRFLVLCFTFGSFVAHIIASNLEPTLAAAYGVLNLGLAPLGLLLFTKFKPRGTRVLWLSLFMGVSGFVIILVGQLVPLMGDLLGNYGVAVGHLEPGTRLSRATAASTAGLSNTFQPDRFCHHAASARGHA